MRPGTDSSPNASDTSVFQYVISNMCGPHATQPSLKRVVAPALQASPAYFRIAANHAGNLGSLRTDPRRPCEVSLEAHPILDLLLQRLFIITSQPLDDCMDLCLRPALLLL